MLSALRPAALARVRFPLGELTKPQVREIARGGGAAGGREAGEPGPVLPGRHDARALPRTPRRRRVTAPARSSTRAGACSGAIAATATTPSASAAASAWPPASRCSCSATDAAANRVVVGPREELAARHRRAAGRDAEPRRAARGPREAALPLRAAAVSRGRRAPGHHDALTATLAEQAHGVAPGQTACLMDGDLVVGHGTIAASRCRPLHRPPHKLTRDGPPRSSAEIREAFLSFFEERDHRRMPSGSLIPSSYDPSVLLTTAGMQPFKPYFLGQEEPPHPRLTSCQKCFRTTDIDQVGSTARHLTFFEMLGNFSFGDYFKQEAVEFAWELSLDGLRARPRADLDHRVRGRPGARPRAGRGGDRVLALGRRAGRADRAPAALGELLAGRAGRALRARAPSSTSTGARTSAATTTAPATTPTASSSTGTSSSCSTRCTRTARSSRCPQQNIDTGLGLERMAAILQDVPSVFENDQFRPLVELGEELSGRRYGEDFATTRALRVLADHSRAMTFLIADGVVPSNEDRGYILRRVMRRAIQQGRSIGLEPPFLGRFADRVIEIMGDVVPGAARGARDDPPLARLRGGELRPHARAGHAAARPTWSSARRPTAPRGSTRATRSSCTTPTASRTTSRASCSRRRGCRWTTPASTS